MGPFKSKMHTSVLDAASQSVNVRLCIRLLAALWGDRATPQPTVCMVRGRQLSSSPLPGAGAAFSTASTPMPSGPALRSAATAIALHAADWSWAAESCSATCK